MIEVGQKVRFQPGKNGIGFASEDTRRKEMTGTVMLVNTPNRWFSVESDCGGVKLRYSFMFGQIGKDVRVCG